ncbi:hypothetical protein [Cognataquiflexum nitidum]|uniref:hypothetical protein n=1 Tax=Cognataquiflexum nitidum TaxID=2922272 RepID=UPI001F145B58|nr:hypothetical protein [Cognataquiflexum nitidum]
MKFPPSASSGNGDSVFGRGGGKSGAALFSSPPLPRTFSVADPNRNLGRGQFVPINVITLSELF